MDYQNWNVIIEIDVKQEAGWWLLWTNWWYVSQQDRRGQRANHSNHHSSIGLIIILLLGVIMVNIILLSWRKIRLCCVDYIRCMARCLFSEFVLLCSVSVSSEMCLVVWVRNLAELNGSVQAWRLLAGEGVLGVVTGQGLLVEHGGVATEEAPLGRLYDVAVVVLDGEADVEHLKTDPDLLSSIMTSLTSQPLSTSA